MNLNNLFTPIIIEQFPNYMIFNNLYTHRIIYDKMNNLENKYVFINLNNLFTPRIIEQLPKHVYMNLMT